MNKENIAALIIAAGYSSRMHDFKPLLPLGGKKALNILIDTYKKFGLKKIYVVVGYKQEDVIEALKQEDVDIIYNENYDKGMFSSIQKGLQALDENVKAFFMQPVDIPLIKVESLESLYEAYTKEQKGVMYPTFLGKKGHPPLIDTKYKEQILASDGEGGLKKVLENFDEDSLHVKVIEQSVLMDMDTLEDYKTLISYGAISVPNEQECLAIMEKDEVDEHIIQHCKAVAKMAISLYDELLEYNFDFNKHELLAAALLHDISRKEKNHAFVGAQKLRSMGYINVGNIIETHMDIEVDMKGPLSANEILFLADKLVSEDTVCGFKERFDRALKRCAGNEEAVNNIRKRLQSTKDIIKKIEILTGKTFLYG